MPKVLMVLPNDELGGAEQIMRMIAHNLDFSVLNIHFLTRRKSDNWEFKQKNIDIFYTNTSHILIGIVQFIFYFFKSPKKRFDYVITTHAFVTGLVGILISFNLIKSNIFIGRESTEIFRRYSGLKLVFYRFLYYYGYSKLNLLICQTERMKQNLIYNVPGIEKKINIKVVPNPIDLSSINVQSIDIDKPFIVGAGRLIREKGFDLLIEAFKDFLVIHPEYKLLILGEGKERVNLELLINNLNLKNNVVLMGKVANVYSYFKYAKLCVVSSRIEGFPNVLLQMMSQNAKVVSTNCAGEINNIKGIFLADVNNTDSLYNAILSGIHSDCINTQNYFNLYLEERSIKNFIYNVFQFE
jgi:glycosyltransferase involved in cell wall biosynthesis